MKKGICLLSAVPLRETPSHKSQLVSQLLFGESYTVLEEGPEWMLVRCMHDGYTGWLRNNQRAAWDASMEARTLNTALLHTVSIGENTFPVSLGAYLPSSSWHTAWGVCKTGILPQPSGNDLLMHYASLLLHSPYLWGGRTPMGIDCSGLSQLILRLLGVDIYRDAAQQAMQGETVNFIHEARPGDLAFFDNEEGMITHVGIILPDQKIIHAHGRVRVDRVDHEGIFDGKQKKYSHRLRIIRRFKIG